MSYSLPIVTTKVKDGIHNVNAYTDEEVRTYFPFASKQTFVSNPTIADPKAGINTAVSASPLTVELKADKVRRRSESSETSEGGVWKFGWMKPVISLLTHFKDDGCCSYDCSSCRDKFAIVLSGCVPSSDSSSKTNQPVEDAAHERWISL